MKHVRSLLLVYGFCLVAVLVCGAVTAAADFLVKVADTVFHVEPTLEHSHGH